MKGWKMPRYILLDHNCGFVWGDTGDLDGPARDETPEDAARRLDESLGVFGRTYESHGPNYRPSSGLASAYHVYSAEIAFPPVEDGQDQATIEAVERDCRKVAVVTVTDSQED